MKKSFDGRRIFRKQEKDREIIDSFHKFVQISNKINVEKKLNIYYYRICVVCYFADNLLELCRKGNHYE